LLLLMAAGTAGAALVALPIPVTSVMLGRDVAAMARCCCSLVLGASCPPPAAPLPPCMAPAAAVVALPVKLLRGAALAGGSNPKGILLRAWAAAVASWVS
jgi:hypothetical protein